MKDVRLSSVGRDGMGRTTIDDSRRQKYSKRAGADKLSVIARTCPNCFHHKSFSTVRLTKCTRCKSTVWK